jgi:hypothetical protein
LFVWCEDFLALFEGLCLQVVTVQPGYIKSDIVAKLGSDHVDKAVQLADKHRLLYPGFGRYVREHFLGSDLQRGVEPVVTSEAIWKALVARAPGPLVGKQRFVLLLLLLFVSF